MKFLNLFHHRSQQQSSFDSIQGYQDIKNIVKRALQSEENFNLLLIGPPASSKTQFLMEIMNFYKDCVYFDASNTTNRILQVLEEERPRIVLLDELDKLPRNFSEKLLGFLESGRIKVDQKNLQLDFELKGCKVFATANEINRISKPLASRFRKLFLPRYSEQQFIEIAVKVLPKINENLARYIGSTTFRNGRDIRDVLSIGKLVKKSDGPEAVDLILKTLMKYGKEEKGEK
jgi:replication-associated recombination protein RarA